MDQRAQLSEFLRSRRARLLPEDIGLTTTGNQRRVKGLRREELARLAGISVEYYVRLEQGRSQNISDAVLDSVARALRLTDDEHTHLQNLARPVRRRRRAVPPQRVRPSLERLLAALDTPAFIYGRRLDVLAWNRLACALLVNFAELPSGERNLARLMFLDESARELYPDWERVARDTVGSLRLAAGRDVDDPELASLVGDLSVRSEAFRRYWADHPVLNKTHGQKRFHHPIVGEFTLSYDTIRLTDDSEQALLAYTAEAGSPAEVSLRLLAAWDISNDAAPPQTVHASRNSGAPPVD
jgi:transcriptional regulator with XRE-family HTH domain